MILIEACGRLLFLWCVLSLSAKSEIVAPNVERFWNIPPQRFLLVLFLIRYGHTSKSIFSIAGVVLARLNQTVRLDALPSWLLCAPRAAGNLLVLSSLVLLLAAHPPAVRHKKRYICCTLDAHLHEQRRANRGVRASVVRRLGRVSEGGASGGTLLDSSLKVCPVGRLRVVGGPFPTL